MWVSRVRLKLWVLTLLRPFSVHGYEHTCEGVKHGVHFV